MKRIFLIAVISSLLLACNEVEDKDIQSANEEVTESVETLILKDAEIEEVEEVAESEADLFSSTCSQSYVNHYGRMWKNQLLLNKTFGWRYKHGRCPGLTADSVGAEFPKTITIDYGEGMEFCVNRDICRTISGKIITTLSAPPHESGSTREITYENFTIDSLSLSGTKTMTFEGTDSTRIITLSSNMTYTFADSSTVTRKVNRTKTWVEGLDTPFNRFDDVIEITGSVEITDKEGNVLLKEISTPLVKTGSCLFTTQGVVTIYKNGEEVGSLDYGDGECDFKAELTINGETEELFVGLKCGKFRV